MIRIFIYYFLEKESDNRNGRMININTPLQILRFKFLKVYIVEVKMKRVKLFMFLQ